MTKNKKTEEDNENVEETTGGNPVLTLEVGHDEVTVFTPTVMIDGREIVELGEEGLKELHKNVKAVYDDDIKNSDFDECETLRSVMKGRILLRDERTDVITRDRENRPTYIPFDMDEQRMRNRILLAIDVSTKEKPLKIGKSIKIDFHSTSDDNQRCKYEDLVHLSEHMILFCKDQTAVLPYIADVHDKYVTLKAEAEAAIAKKK